VNIFRFELRSQLKSILIWTLTLSAVCALMMAIFPAYYESADVIRSMLKGFPPGVLKALGMNIDTLFGVTGFYSFLLFYISLVGGVQAAVLGIGIMSRESREKNSDFLMTKPVKRHTVVTAKLCAALTELLITNIVYIIVSVIMSMAVAEKNPDIQTIVMLSLTLFFIQLAFMCIGAAAASFLRIKSVNTSALVLIVIFFVITMSESFTGKEALKYLTPFRFFDTTKIVLNNSYELSSFIILFIICAACVAAAYIRSIRRDINAV
jgi:ABC-2 type transport system permease protein